METNKLTKFTSVIRDCADGCQSSTPDDECRNRAKRMHPCRTHGNLEISEILAWQICQMGQIGLPALQIGQIGCLSARDGANLHRGPRLPDLQIGQIGLLPVQIGLISCKYALFGLSATRQICLLEAYLANLQNTVCANRPNRPPVGLFVLLQIGQIGPICRK